MNRIDQFPQTTDIATLSPSDQQRAGQTTRVASRWRVRMETDLNTDALKELYVDNETARIFLDHVARRRHNQSETKVDRILAVLKAEGHDIARGDMIQLFRGLEEIECGRFVVGRWNWPSRFVWQVNMINVAKAAAGEPVTIEEQPDDESSEPDDVSMREHSYHLRSDLVITFRLPTDLTQTEADRLAGMIKTLPIESD